MNPSVLSKFGLKMAGLKRQVRTPLAPLGFATVYTQVEREQVSIPGKGIQTGADRELE